MTLFGKVTKTRIPLPSAQVRIRFKKTGAHRFSTVTTLTTGATGRYRATVTASRSGTWQAVHPATPAVARTSRATDKITLRR